MPIVNCNVVGCAYMTADVGDAVGAVMLARHYSDRHPTPAPSKQPALPQPKIEGDVYEEK